MDPGPELGPDTDTETGSDSGTALGPETGSGTGTDTDPGLGPGSGPGPDPGTGLGPDSEMGTGAGPGTETDPGSRTGSGLMSDPYMEAAAKELGYVADDHLNTLWSDPTLVPAARRIIQAWIGDRTLYEQGDLHAMDVVYDTVTGDPSHPLAYEMISKLVEVGALLKVSDE